MCAGKLPPVQLLLPCPPHILSLSIYFLTYNFFPCIKGDLPLILWANLLAIEQFPLSPNCVIGGTS